MTYAPEFTSSAQAAWQRLDVALQEEVLDVIDRLAANPESARRSNASPERVFDFTHEIGHVRHFVFLTLRVSHSARKLIVLTIGHAERAL